MLIDRLKPQLRNLLKTIFSGLSQPCLLPYKIVVGFFTGVLLGAAILFHDYRTFTEDTRSFIASPNTRYWFALSILSLGCCSAILVTIVEWLWCLRKKTTGLRWYMYLIAGAWLVMMYVIVRGTLSTFFSYECNYSLYFPGSQNKSWYLGLAVYFALAAGGVGMLGLSYSAQQLLRDSELTDGQLIERFAQFKDGATRLLVFFVINIAVYPLTIRAKILAIEQVCSTAEKTNLDMYANPKVYLAYGAFFSILLLLAYVPPYVSLYEVGKKLCNKLMPIPAVSDADWMDKFEKRKEIAALLGVNKTWVDSLVTAASLSIPFISGLYTFLTSKP